MTNTVQQGLKAKDDRIAQQKAIIEKTIQEINKLAPNAEIVKTQYTEKLIHYTASVHNGKIVTHKQENVIYIKSVAEKLVKNKYFTKQEAIDAIKIHLQEAISIAKQFGHKLKQLQAEFQENSVYMDYTMEGDVYGIDESYLDINLKVNGFCFNFDFDRIMNK